MNSSEPVLPSPAEHFRKAAELLDGITGRSQVIDRAIAHIALATAVDQASRSQQGLLAGKSYQASLSEVLGKLLPPDD